MELFYILLLWLVAISLYRTLHFLLITFKGYRWWYRNVYLRTFHWRFTRWVKLWLSGHRCRICGARRRLDIHHRTYRHLWMEWLFPWELEVLCRRHHSQRHGG